MIRVIRVITSRKISWLLRGVKGKLGMMSFCGDRSVRVGRVIRVIRIVRVYRVIRVLRCLDF